MRRAPDDGRAFGGGAPLRVRPEPLNEAAQALLGVDDARALDLAEQAAQLSSAQNAPEARARALLIQGRAHAGRSDAASALRCLEQALTGFQTLDLPAAQCEVLEACGRIHLQAGDVPRAEAVLDQALALAVGLDGGRTEARLLNLMAGVHHRAGAYGRCIEQLQRALALHHAAGDLTGEANLLCNLGVVHTSLGQYAQALDHLTRAYGLLQSRVQDEQTLSSVLLNLGYLYLDMRDPQQASVYFEQALETAQDRSDHQSEATAVLNLGVAHAAAGQDPAAATAFGRALQLARQLGYRSGEISALDGLGGVQARSGEWAAAAGLHAEAAQIACLAEDLEGELDALIHLGQAHTRLGDVAAAQQALRRALDLATQADHPKALSETHLALSELCETGGDDRAALHHFKAHHAAEQALLGEQNAQATRELSVRFEVERTQHESELRRAERDAAQLAQAEAQRLVRARTAELEQAQLEVVTRLAVAAEYRDDLTGEHTVRVGRFAGLIAQELGWPPAEVELLRTAARLHDVGKIGIPDAVLLKPGRFTPEEFERMKTHTLIGARILSGGESRLLRLAEEIALSHHERWDGQGYPLARAGEAIPLSGRIVAVADVFDALTQARPYKPAWTVEAALAEIERQAGAQFDAAVVAAGLRVFATPEVRAILNRPGAA